MYENGGGSKGAAIAALVFGILSIVCLCCGIGALFGIVGLILAIIVLAGRKNGKGLAIAGLIMSIISILVTVLAIAKVMPYVDSLMDLTVNAEQYIEEYEETGEVPEFFEKLGEDYNMSEEDVQELMETFIESYNEASASPTATNILAVYTE